MLKFFFYGEVFFTTTQRRNNAGRRLDGYVSNTGFVAEIWDQLLILNAAWPAGRADISGVSDSGATVPGLRFCYSTTDPAAADAAVTDVTQNFVRFEDTNSFWGYVGQPIAAAKK